VAISPRAGDVAVRVVGLSKSYRISHVEQARTIRDSVQLFVTQPRARLRALLRRGEVETIWALRDASFELARGQVLGVIGRNGAGKSTLLKILSRITEPTEGYADINGRLASLLEVGTGFHPELTGRDNIFLNGAILGMRRTEIAARYDEIVEFAGVERFIDTPVKRYSSGMFMRLAFAVAAHLEPDILLVDEILAVGDAEFQRKSLGKMREVTGEGRTVIFVSHNMGAIRTLCDRAILLRDGRIVADGDVDDAVTKYLEDAVGAEVDGHIPAHAARLGTGEARFTHVTIVGDDLRQVPHVYLGQRFTVVVTAEVTTRLRDAVFEIGISTVDGIRVATSFSTDRGQQPWALMPGPTTAALELDVVLIPGRYTVDLGMHYSAGRTIDYVERVFEFEALDTAERGDDTFRHTQRRGFVRPHGRWHAPPELRLRAAQDAH